MFLRTIRTSLSFSNKLMLIWILLVRTNQRSSANLRKRRRKKPLLNSTLQHLCSHPLLCCQMLFLRLSLRWLMRLLMLCLSLLHELSTNEMLALLLCIISVLTVNSAPISHKVLNPYDSSVSGFRGSCEQLALTCRLNVNPYAFHAAATTGSPVPIPRACVSFRTVCSAWPKYDFGYLMSPDVYVVTTTPDGKYKYELNSLAFTPEGARLFYTLVDGYAHERRKIIKDGHREKLPDLDAEYIIHPTEGQ
uniref:ORF7 protein n=1 Tax=Bat Coronavirus MsGD16 TaxID=3018863 RepID=A0AA49EEH9_9NIDO|nr:ORF7 protein [Bat Coronavirus MsGD16]